MDKKKYSIIKQYSFLMVPKSLFLYKVSKKTYKMIDFLNINVLKIKIKTFMLSEKRRPFLNKNELIPHFREDITKLSNIIDINLNNWLKL